MAEGKGDVYNIANRNVVSVEKLAQMVLAVAQSSKPPQKRAVGDGIRRQNREVFVRIPSTRKAEAELDFLAQVELQQGLEHLYEWYQSESVVETTFLP